MVKNCLRCDKRLIITNTYHGVCDKCKLENINLMREIKIVSDKKSKHKRFKK